MESILLILVILALIAVGVLYTSQRKIARDVDTIKDELGRQKNLGDILSATEDTLGEAGKAINTAKKVMDGRITRMEELIDEVDRKINYLEKLSRTSETKPESTSRASTTPIDQPLTSPKPIDPDAKEREFILKRNRRIILMLEEGKPLEEIARVTGASIREIKLIQKFTDNRGL